jgi:hypothetical protein
VVVGRENDINKLISNCSDNILPVYLDIDNPETEGDRLSAKDPNRATLYEHDISCCSATSL